MGRADAPIFVISGYLHALRSLALPGPFHGPYTHVQLDMSQPRFVILADGDFGPLTSKTANPIIRYRPEQTLAVVDHLQAGKTAQDVLGFGGNIPVVATMSEGLAFKPTAVLIGIAPTGGKLPEKWRGWLAEAIAAGCDLWSGLHTFLER